MTRATFNSPEHPDDNPAISPASILRATVVSFVLLTFLTGVVYPLTITMIGKVAFPNQAEGSLLGKNGRATRVESEAVGSSLIGQTFDQPQYFESRPSGRRRPWHEERGFIFRFKYRAVGHRLDRAGPRRCTPSSRSRKQISGSCRPCDRLRVGSGSA